MARVKASEGKGAKGASKGKGAKGAGKGKAKDSDGGKGGKGGKVIPLKAKNLAERAREGDQEAARALEKIVICYESWRTAVRHMAEERRRASDIEGAAAAAFEQAVEAGLPVNADANDIFHKLKDVEEKWQTKKDAEHHAEEIRKAAAEKLKKAVGAMERATTDGAQLTMEAAWEGQEAQSGGGGEPEQDFNEDGQIPEDAALEPDTD